LVVERERLKLIPGGKKASGSASTGSLFAVGGPPMGVRLRHVRSVPDASKAEVWRRVAGTPGEVALRRRDSAAFGNEPAAHAHIDPEDFEWVWTTIHRLRAES